MRKVAVAVASSRWSGSRSSPSAKTMASPRCTRRARPSTVPRRTGRRKHTLNSTVVGHWPGAKVMATAGPMVASSICAMKPPAMPPAGLRQSGFGVYSTAMVPCATSSSTRRHPKNRELGGARQTVVHKAPQGIIALGHRSSPSRCLSALACCAVMQNAAYVCHAPRYQS